MLARQWQGKEDTEGPDATVPAARLDLPASSLTVPFPREGPCDGDLWGVVRLGPIRFAIPFAGRHEKL